MDGQGSRSLILHKAQVARTDSCPELNSIPCAGQHHIVDGVNPVANVEDVGIASAAADHLIVATTAGQDIIPRESRDPIHDVRAGNGIVAVSPGQIKPALDKLVVRQNCTIGKLEGFNRARPQHIGWIETGEMKRAAGRADSNHQ